MESLLDSIIVINMDKDTQRLQEFNFMMTTSGWSYSRKSAVNGKKLLSSQNDIELEDQNLLMKKYIARDAWLTPSEIGCALSHISLWEDLANDPSKNRILIFEDDARTHLDGNTILRLLTEFYTYLNDNNIQEPDMLYLGKALDDCYNYKKVWGDVYISGHPLCLHAYIITKTGAKRLLELAPFFSPIDMIPIQAIKKKVIQVMTFHPSIYFQDIFSGESNQRNLKATLNVTSECLFSQQQPLAPDTWIYMTIVIIGLLAIIILFIIYFT